MQRHSPFVRPGRAESGAASVSAGKLHREAWPERFVLWDSTAPAAPLLDIQGAHRGRNSGSDPEEAEAVRRRPHACAQMATAQTRAVLWDAQRGPSPRSLTPPRGRCRPVQAHASGHIGRDRMLPLRRLLAFAAQGAPLGLAGLLEDGQLQAVTLFAARIPDHGLSLATHAGIFQAPPAPAPQTAPRARACGGVTARGRGGERRFSGSSHPSCGRSRPPQRFVRRTLSRPPRTSPLPSRPEPRCAARLQRDAAGRSAWPTI
jgi:hypothetical protein